MAGSFALSAAGLSIQTVDEIRDMITQGLIAKYGVGVDTSLSTVLGQFVNVIAELMAKNQQVALDVYNSMNPDAAYGVTLDQRASYTGSLREAAKASVVTGDATFTGPGVINNGTIITKDVDGTTWEAINGPYNIGAAGVIPDVQYQATTTGPIIAPFGTAFSITTPVGNYSGFANTEDATVGQDQQSDPAFRRTRKIEQFSQGQGPLGAITAVISRIEGVDAARTYHNTNVQPEDSDGIPYKQFNVVVATTPSPPSPALQQEIFDKLWLVQGPQGRAYGTDYVGQAIDSEGTPQAVAFDLESELDIWINITLTTSTSEMPVSENLAQVVSDAVLNGMNTNHRGLGEDVLAMNVTGIIQQLQQNGEISGVDVVVATVSDDALGPFVSTKQPVGIRERPDFDSSRIAVTEN